MKKDEPRQYTGIVPEIMIECLRKMNAAGYTKEEMITKGTAVDSEGNTVLVTDLKKLYEAIKEQVFFRFTRERPAIDYLIGLTNDETKVVKQIEVNVRERENKPSIRLSLYDSNLFELKEKERHNG